MQVPNWRHHSNKERKRKLKPQALRAAKARRSQLIKRLLNPTKRGVSSYNVLIQKKHMEIVKHEIKSQLAKLLATEDLVVEHRKVETAQFNVRSRVLTLPNWDRASNNVYDSLVAHEVGHALFTPDRDWWLEYKISQQFVNIVEDARIEKLMKRRYAGLAKTFYNGYNELNDRDFFEVNGKDLTTFNLADRLSLIHI